MNIYPVRASEQNGRGFKSHSGQLHIATSKNLSVVNTIYINSLLWTHGIISTKF